MAKAKGGSSRRVATSLNAEKEVEEQPGRVSPQEKRRRNQLCNLAVSVSRGWGELGEDRLADSLIQRVWKKPAVELSRCLPRKTQRVCSALGLIVTDLQIAGGHNGHLDSLRQLHEEVTRFGDTVIEIGRRLPQSDQPHKRVIMACGLKIQASLTTLGIALDL